MRRRIAILALLMIAAMPLAGQQDVFAPGDNLVVEGIPPIPAALAADVDQYGNFRSATISSWHPSKHEMLIGTRFADTLQVHLVKSPGGARTQLTFFRDAARGALIPAGEWRVLYLFEGSRRRRVLPDLSVRRGNWRNHFADGWEIAEYRSALVQRGRSLGVWLDAARWREFGPLYSEARRREE